MGWRGAVELAASPVLADQWRDAIGGGTEWRGKGAPGIHWGPAARLHSSALFQDWVHLRRQDCAPITSCCVCILLPARALTCTSGTASRSPPGCVPAMDPSKSRRPLKRQRVE